MLGPLAIIASFSVAIVLLNTQAANADWTADLTPCALRCAVGAANATDCKLSDLQCLCKSPTFVVDFTKCVRANCPTLEDTTFANTTLPRICDPQNWIWQLPECVRDCALRAAHAVGCDVTDRKCLCSSEFLEYWVKCVGENCGDEGLQIVRDWYSRLCDDTVVTL